MYRAYLLNARYDVRKTSRALGMLYIDRRHEFHELSGVLLNDKAMRMMPHWKEFVLNFSLDVEDAFDQWSGHLPLLVNSPQKTLTLLRQLGRGQTSMNGLIHLLNMAYTISVEFKEIYRRLK